MDPFGGLTSMLLQLVPYIAIICIIIFLCAAIYCKIFRN